MSDEIDSTAWTGDYPKRAHISLASPDERKKIRRVAFAVGIALTLVVGGSIIAQVAK